MFIFSTVMLNFKIRPPFYGIDARKYFVYFIYIAKQTWATKKIFFFKFHDPVIYFKMEQIKNINFCIICTYDLHSLKPTSGLVENLDCRNFNENKKFRYPLLAKKFRLL